MLKNKKLQFITLFHFSVVLYLIITLLIYFVALKEGNNGITLNLFGGTDDGYFYWDQAQNIANGRPWIRTSIYPYIIGMLVKTTGINDVLIIRVFNLFGFILFLLTSIGLIKWQYTHDSAIYNKKMRYSSYMLLIILLLGYLSMHMIASLSIYRDIWISLFFSLSVLLSSKILFKNTNSMITLSFLVLSGAALLGFRNYALAAFLTGLLIHLLFTRIEKPARLIIIVTILFSLYYTFFIDLTLPLVNLSLRDALEFRSINLENFAGGSQMGIELVQSNFILFFLNYIVSYIGNLVGPLPWLINSPAMLLVFVFESLPMIYMLFYLYNKKNLITKGQRYILLQAFIWIAFIAISNDNIGTAARLRVISWVLIFTVIATIWVKEKYEIREQSNKKI